MFLLTLFCQTSETYPGVMVSLPVNHRRVETDNFYQKDENNVSIIDVTKQDATYENKTFQQSSMDCFFYSIKPPGQGELEIGLQSLSLMKSGNSLYPIVVKDLEVSNVNST